MEAEWVSAIATCVGSVAAGGALWFAYSQIRLTARQMRESAAQEARDSEARTRPYVSVEIVPGLAGPGSMDIVFANHGRTTARNVRVSLVGDDFRAQSEEDEIGPALGRMFANRFELAPGARRRVFWQIPANDDESRSQFGTPLIGVVAVSYAWKPDGAETERRYADEFRYDLTEYPKLIPVPYSGPNASGTSADAHERNVVHALRAIARNVAENTR